MTSLCISEQSTAPACARRSIEPQARTGREPRRVHVSRQRIEAGPTGGEARRPRLAPAARFEALVALAQGGGFSAYDFGDLVPGHACMQTQREQMSAPADRGFRAASRRHRRMSSSRTAAGSLRSRLRCRRSPWCAARGSAFAPALSGSRARRSRPAGRARCAATTAAGTWEGRGFSQTRENTSSAAGSSRRSASRYPAISSP